MFRQIVGANLDHGQTSYQLDHHQEKTRKLSLLQRNPWLQSWVIVNLDKD